MFKRITLENFFSFSEPTTIELNREVNILVGINGSGKSNFLKAIRFLYECISGNGLEKIFLGEWGGFNDVANFNESKAETIRLVYEFDSEVINKEYGKTEYAFQGNPIYEIIIYKTGGTSYYLKEVIVAENKLNGAYITFLSMENGKGNIITVNKNNSFTVQEYSQNKGMVSFLEQELVLRQVSDPDRFPQLYILKQAISSLVSYNYFDTSADSKLRQKSFKGIEPKLLPTGENLVQILLRIKSNNTLQFEKIEDYLKKVNPNFKDINFDFLGDNHYLTLREKFLDKTVGISHISDGTLRFLLLLSVFFNPNRGQVVCMDEPETGLHPDMINTIAESIKIAARNNSQFIIATHSPMLLNCFDIEDIIVFEKDGQNKTIVTRKTEADFEDWNDDFLVGQLWLRGKIGGKRW